MKTLNRFRSGRRGAFTVTEMCIVMAVGFVLISSLWMICRGVMLAGRSTEDTAAAVERAQLAMERVRTDLLAANAGQAEVNEAGGLQIGNQGELAASFETSDGVLVRDAGGKRTDGPEETRVEFTHPPQRPWAVLVRVRSTSRGRGVQLQAEHACENTAREAQYPGWNPLPGPEEQSAVE